ncbi:MAG: polyphosphate polymerase domain-containing protein [Bacillota bacterium]
MQTVFKRRELKYLLTLEQKDALMELINEHMVADKYAKYTIFNLYYDTPNFLLIRRSIEKPMYKEKLRVRSYDKATANSTVFLEIKKKFDNIVYKRRITLKEAHVTSYFNGKSELRDTQISHEIDYFKKCYPDLAPRVMISYDRQAYSGKEDSDLRVTFDQNALWRDTDLSLKSSCYGTAILPDDYILLEVKAKNALPLWLVHFFTAHAIYRTSFSKYGTAYKQIITSAKENDKKCSNQ